MAPVIAFDAVRHAFAGTDGTPITALDGVTFDVGRHEFLSILGPSGCGKSTLLRLMAGLIAPSGGALSVYGQPVSEPRDDIGIVFQRPTLLPWFDVVGNVTFPMRHKYGRVTAVELERAHGCSPWSGWRSSPAGASTNCPAACSSASPSPAPCCSIRTSC